MNPPPEAPPILNPAPPTTQTLRRLFLTLYLRGRGARGIRVTTAPKSVARKLILAILFYLLFGSFAASFIHKPVFALAVYLHGMTFVFLGMFVSSSAGEVLFNKEEGDILLHRPVSARELLWSKIRVLIEVSLWLAGALNLVGLFVGISAPDGGILFPFVHAISTILEALFCTGCIVLAYQLCLRWFGRERLDSIMTTAQVLVAIAAVSAGQIMPRLLLRFNNAGLLRFNSNTWWLGFFPPAWFAGFDEALAGHGKLGPWLLAALAVLVTALVMWLAFGKLAGTYETGLQNLNETTSRPRSRSQRRWMETLIDSPPLKWLFRTPISRASFLLTAAYLCRDRDVKLRVFPSLAPMLIIPFVFMLQDERAPANFFLALAAGFLASIPLVALDLLQYSQQWQASDIFRVAPMKGPAELCHGARRAVLLLLAFPAFVAVGLIMCMIQRDASKLLLFLPGMILTPVAALIPALLNRGIPLSMPSEESKSAGRSLKMLGVMVLAAVLSGLTAWTLAVGWFAWMIAAELMLVIPTYLGLRFLVSKMRWRSIE